MTTKSDICVRVEHIQSTFRRMVTGDEWIADAVIAILDKQFELTVLDVNNNDSAIRRYETRGYELISIILTHYAKHEQDVLAECSAVPGASNG